MTLNSHNKQQMSTSRNRSRVSISLQKMVISSWQKTMVATAAVKKLQKLMAAKDPSIIAAEYDRSSSRREAHDSK